jgi:cytidylate kinase
VQLSNGRITAQVVDDAFAQIRQPGRSARPVLDGRDLATTNEAYVKAFRSAASRRWNRR